MKIDKDNNMSIYSHIGMSIAIFLTTLIIFSNILIISINKQDNNSIIFGIVMLFLYLLGLGFLIKSFLIFKQFKKLNLQCKNFSSIEELTKSIEKDKKNDFIYENYQSYKSSLRPIKDITRDSKIKYYSTMSADYFLNDNTIIYNNLKIRTINSLANSLTGLGILGTFYGLIKGLEGLNSSEIQSGIGVLLDGVNTSFTTSLIGITLSLSLTFIVKYTIDSISIEISRLVNFINSKVQTSSSVEGFKELENQLTIQTTSIQKLATDISEHISNQFVASLTETLKPLFENLDASMNNLSDLNKETFVKFSQTSSETITEMINSSSDLFNSNISKEINTLKDSLGLICEKNTEFLNNINESIAKMESLAKTQEEAINNITNSVIDVKNMKEVINLVNKELTENYTTFNTYTTNQNASIENLKEALSIAVEVSNSQKNISENIIVVQDNISNNLTEIVEKYSELIENQNDYIESYSDINENILDSIDTLNEKTDIIDSYIDRQLNMLDEINNSTANVVNNLSSSSELIDYMNTTLNSLASSNVQLNDITANLGELSSLVQQISRIDEVFNNCANKLDSISKAINVGIDEYETKLDTATYKVLKTYDTEVSKCINSLFKITSHLDSVTTGIQDSTYKIAENLKDFKDIILVDLEDDEGNLDE